MPSPKRTHVPAVELQLSPATKAVLTIGRGVYIDQGTGRITYLNERELHNLIAARTEAEQAGEG